MPHKLGADYIVTSVTITSLCFTILLCIIAFSLSFRFRSHLSCDYSKIITPTKCFSVVGKAPMRSVRFSAWILLSEMICLESEMLQTVEKIIFGNFFSQQQLQRNVVPLLKVRIDDYLCKGQAKQSKCIFCSIMPRNIDGDTQRFYLCYHIIWCVYLLFECETS